MKDLLSVPVLVLSPHADDAVLSCGGLLLQHTDARVITACSGDAPQKRLPALCGLATPSQRRQEDALAMSKLGAALEELAIPDAIDRRDEGGALFYASISSLFGVVGKTDGKLCATIQEAVRERLGERTLLCPMAVGAHVDHQICAHVGRRLLGEGHSVWFYEDAPYVFPKTGSAIAPDTVLHAAGRLRGRVRGTMDVSIDPQAKAEVLQCYSTQIDGLFGGIGPYMELAKAHYTALGGDLERFYKLRWQ